MKVRDDFRIRTMRRDDVAFAVDLAAREGWNPGLHDAECFYLADAGGFLLGELNAEPVGCISAVSYRGRYGFVGLYIVRPEFRAQGHGLRLWQAALDRLAGHDVGLDGVVAQQPNYAKSGFRLAYRNIRYRGRAEAAPTHWSIVPAVDVPISAIGELDQTIFPERRDAFLKQWLTQPDSGAYVARDGTRLRGYTVVRKCREGWKIGPLMADDAATAQRLYDAASAHAVPGEAIFLDVPEPNRAAQSLAESRGLTPVFETARMYTGDQPAIDLTKLYGVTTFELG
jgi:GNAT superfamily N-acetyltransferase